MAPIVSIRQTLINILNSENFAYAISLSDSPDQLFHISRRKRKQVVFRVRYIRNHEWSSARRRILQIVSFSSGIYRPRHQK